MPLSLPLLSRRSPLPVASVSSRRQRPLALAEVPMPLQSHASQPARKDETVSCTLWHESSFDLQRGLEVAEFPSWPADWPATAPALPTHAATAP